MSNHILKRRTLLKQLGAAAFLATPVFRSALSEAQAKAPLRLILLNLPGGIRFKSEGDLNFYFDTLAKPFLPLQADMNIIDKAASPAAELITTFFELEGHGGGARTMFGGKTEGQGCNGPNSCGDESLAYHYGEASSIDQIVADQIGSRTQFASLHFGSLWQTDNGACNQCFFNKGQPVRPTSDPLAAFMRVFGNGVPSAMPSPTGQPAVDPALLNEYYRGKSRLDRLRAEISAVKQIAGSAEQSKLDLHLDALRELEKSLPNIGGGAGGMVGASCQLPETPKALVLTADGQTPRGNPMELPESSAAFNKIAYQAINCDLTRVLGLQWLSSGDGIPRFEWMGIKQDHHTLEHGGDPAAYDAAQTYLFSQMAEFMLMLKNTPEGSGTMLDNSIVYMTSEMCNGDHIHSPVLQFVAGKAGGQFTTGRRLNASGKNNNDVLLTLVQAMGVNATIVGDAKFNTGAFSLA